VGICLQEHLFELETAQAVDPAAIYVIYPDETASAWRVQAVPVTSESFASRKALPEKWRGLRDEDLTNESGVPGGIFVHASGFIGGIRFSPFFVSLSHFHFAGNKTKDGAIKLAQLALTL
jgi:uncharacterized UPF0160 family protein